MLMTETATMNDVNDGNGGGGGGGGGAQLGGLGGGGGDDAVIPIAPEASLALAATIAESNENVNINNLNGNEDDHAAIVAASTSRYSLRKRSRAAPTSGGGNTDGTNRRTANVNTNGQYEQDEYGFVDTGAAFTDRQFEALLEKYEKDGAKERDEKKRRLERGYGDDDYPYVAPDEPISLDDLPKKCLQLIFELLPTVRSIFNLAYQSNAMLSCVDGRTDIVVRAAVHGNATNGNQQQAKHTMTNLIEMVRKRAIHVPNTTRLLRLLCAQRCERGENCWGYNLQTSLSSCKGVHGNSRRPYSLALCNRCTTDCGAAFKFIRASRWERWWQHWARNDDKLVKANYDHFFNPEKAADVAIGPQGEPLGPIMNARHLRHVLVKHRGNADGQKEAFVALVDEVYGKEGSEEWAEHEEACQDLLDCFDQAEGDLNDWIDHRDKTERDERDQKNKKIIAKRKEKLEPLISAFESSVADVSLKNLTGFEWNERTYGEGVQFDYFFVRDSFGTMLSAPSSVTTRKIKASVIELRRRLDIISNNDEFFQLSFLPAASFSRDLSTATLDQRAMCQVAQYCQDRSLSGTKAILGTSYYRRYEENASGRWGRTPPVDDNHTNRRFFDVLEKKDYKTSILHVIHARKALDKVARGVLTWIMPTANNRTLALHVWHNYVNNREGGESSEWTWDDFIAALGNCRDELANQRHNARDYLNHQAVKDFLALPPHPWSTSFTRQRAIDTVWDPQTKGLSTRYWNIPENLQGLVPYDLLRERNFDSLLSIHRFYYQRRTTNLHG